jgi:hypothetical protein
VLVGHWRLLVRPVVRRLERRALAATVRPFRRPLVLVVRPRMRHQETLVLVVRLTCVVVLAVPPRELEALRAVLVERST